MGIVIIGGLLSCLAFWFADRAEDRRVMAMLEFRADWRARDLEAKVRLAGNPVENIAIVMAANPVIGPDEFKRVAVRARHDLEHVNSLQWAPRVERERIPSFELEARALGLLDYRVFDVTPDFQPEPISDRPEYFPVLFDERFQGSRHVLGLALGKHAGRRIPMEKARDEGRPIATLPVRPVGPMSDKLVYLIFWPVYDGITVPTTVEERRVNLRGYAIGNYDLVAFLTAALDNTPALIADLHFVLQGEHRHGAPEEASAHYSINQGKITLGAGESPPEPAVRLVREFTVLDQHWDIIFDFAPSTVSNLRSADPFGWLLAGLLLTASAAFYVAREKNRRQVIEELVAQRTAELQRTSEQLHQAQKMEAIGNLTGGMAHDFNNLLAIVIGNLDLLQDRVKNNPEAMALSEAALQASLRGEELTRQLLAFARRQPLEPRVTDVNQLVLGMTRLLERILEENIEVVVTTTPDVWPVLIDAAQLNAAIANLATNARDAMPKGGRLTIETKSAHLDEDYVALNPDVQPGDYVLIEVSDTGVGMSPETLSQAFEPFFTTKPAGHGTGLGLSMVFGFVKQSRGHVKIYSEPGQGTTVRLYLPRAEGSPAVAQAPAPEPATQSERRETILVVEDDADVRRVVIRQVSELGYAVLEAANAQAALAILGDQDKVVDLLFTDLVMPGGMNGVELAQAAKALRPGLRVLFTSGYTGNTLRSSDRIPDDAPFLSKPYRKHELAEKLRQVLPA
ncbi:CHASE domain-containing protein [Dongia deserti]|uniref:CHASE domain-containing protein n=1 Tax=Dongia deserti TaxID=2268030 RepID=UPI0013C4168F|nr:CHASE domain-containing protein [Dongia deserti]